MSENQTIYGFDDSGCKHEVLSKKDVYTKTEIDNTMGIANEKLSEIISKDDISIIYGVLNNGSSTIVYPVGFTWDNCMVHSIMFRNTNNNRWSYGATFDSSGVITGAIPCNIFLEEDSISINTKNIGLTNGVNPAVSDVNIALEFRIVLMKIPDLNL